MGTPKNASVSTKQAPTKIVPPKGFKRVGQPDIDGWLVPVEGKTIQGKLVGLMTIEQEDGSRESLLIELEAPALGKDAQSKEERQLAPGEIGALGINRAIADLKAYVSKQGRVLLVSKGKHDIGKGKTMWKWEAFCDGERSTPPAPVAAPQSQDDDIRF